MRKDIIHRKRDPNAKQMKRREFSVIDKDFVANFLAKYPHHRVMYPKANFSKRDMAERMRSLMEKINAKFRQVCLTERDGIELPENFGTIFIGAIPNAEFCIDRKESTKLGRRVYHKNWDTDGLLAKIYWCQDYQGKSRYKSIWNFKAVLPFKQEVSKAFRENYGNYRRIEDRMDLAKLYDERQQKVKKRTMAKVPASYNEFEM